MFTIDKFKAEADKAGLKIKSMITRYNLGTEPMQKIHEIELKHGYIRYVKVLDRETDANVYCGESTKIGVSFKSVRSMVNQLVNIKEDQLPWKSGHDYMAMIDEKLTRVHLAVQPIPKSSRIIVGLYNEKGVRNDAVEIPKRDMRYLIRQ